MPARHEALPLGTRLDEYEIRAVLGEGPLGCVYLVSESGSEQAGRERLHVIREYLPVALAARGDGPLVALRSVTGSPDGSANAATYRQGLRAFVNEGLLLSQLDHPALMRVERTWEANHTAYMLLPRHESTTLAAARAAMARPPAEGWVRNLIRSLSGALSALHGESCLHRNVSPEHVLVLRDGRPLLLGPRAALQVLGDTAQSSLIQPGYSPIEEYGESADVHQGPWTDVYALAALARFVILGSAPLAAPVRAVGDPLVPLAIAVQELRAQHPTVEYSASLLLAIDYAMAVDPRDRPQTLEDFQEVLDNTEHAPIPETSDSEYGRLQASLSAMVDEALVNAPPMRGSPRPSAARHAPRTPIEPVWGHPSTAAATPSGPTIPTLFAEVDDGPATDPLSAHADTEPSFDTQTTAPGALYVDPHDAPVMPAAAATAPVPLPPSAFGAPPSARRRPPASPWPKRLGIAGVLVAVLGIAGWQWRERSAPPPGASEQALQRATEQALQPASAAGGRVVAEPVAAKAAVIETAPVPVPKPPAASAVVAVAATASSPAAAPTAVATPVPAPTPTPAPASAAAAKPAAAPAPVPAAPPAPAASRATPKPRPAAPAATPAPAPSPAPRTACAGRSEFSLYRCMQQQCAKPQNAGHAQCKRLRETDQVD